MLAGNSERADRMRRVLEDYQIEPPEILQGNLQSGFELPSIKLVVITEGEMFTQKQRKARRVDRHLDNAERIKSYTELKVGDYVVHQNHGIGKYLGIGTLEVGGIHKDYLHIVYAAGDRLSVPVEQFDLIQKYVGIEEKEPKVSKLGGADWNRVKSKVRTSVKDIADDLIKLYAERQATTGFGFGEDTPYQQEFEEMFPYDETVDQLRAIQEIKEDMQTPRPMDRLAMRGCRLREDGGCHSGGIQGGYRRQAGCCACSDDDSSAAALRDIPGTILRISRSTSRCLAASERARSRRTR